MELVNNIITTLKVQTTKNHPNEFSLLKTTFFKNNLQYIHEEFVVTPIDNAHANVAFLYKGFYIEVLIKDLGIGKDGMSSNSDT